MTIALLCMVVQTAWAQFSGGSGTQADPYQISYYADRMCLTERYLGTVIRQTSGTTAKEWIDRALITQA